MRDKRLFGAETLGFKFVADFAQCDLDAAKAGFNHIGRLRGGDDEHKDDDGDAHESSKCVRMHGSNRRV